MRTEDRDKVLQNTNGLRKVSPVDDKDPTLETYTRTIKTDAKGNPVERTEFASAMFMPSHFRPNERENFPSSGNTSTAYMKNYLDAQPGDERGHINPNALNGKPVAYNMATQPASINRNVGRDPSNDDWYKNEREMIDYIRKGNGFIRYEVYLEYPNDTSGRPSAYKWTTRYYDTDGAVSRTVSGIARS